MPVEGIGTTRWFGESWGAPVCDPEAHVDTPVGQECFGHEHMHSDRSAVIEPGDQGVMIPYIGTYIYALTCGYHAYHLDCWLHEVGADDR